MMPDELPHEANAPRRDILGALRASIPSGTRERTGAPHLSPQPHPGAYRPPVAAGAEADQSRRIARFVALLEASGAQVVHHDSNDTVPDDAARFDAELGVAESGALWIVPRTTQERQRLFLAEHVAIRVRATSVVDTLHDAYARLDVAASPFGCFVTGPSKTADIEQTLVIGAHGPLGLTVVLLDEHQP